MHALAMHSCAQKGTASGPGFGLLSYISDVGMVCCLLRAELYCHLTHVNNGCSYYPIYPPAPGAMLDSSLASRLQMPCTPDIMLVPSDLNPFAKLASVQKPAPNASKQAAAGRTSTSLGHVVCVNPGRLTKGTGGTFAQIQIAPSQEGKAALAGRPPATNGNVSHAVHSRCKASVIRI